MRCCARAPRVDDPDVAPPHASMTLSSTTSSSSSHAHRERALRETLDAVEDVMREKLRVEYAMRRGFLSMARDRVGDRAAVRASGFDNGVPATLTASVRVRVRGAGDGGVELMTQEGATPRVALGQALRGVATAAMDISDGLAGDLHHLLAASQCGAEVAIDSLPVSPMVATLPVDLRRALAFAGGDDYELLFAAPPNQAARLAHLAAQVGVKITRIGRITDGTALVLRDAKGVAIANDYRGFDHFSP